MKQLEKRFYSRQEIGEILSLNIKDNHFKRNVINTLDRWGYKYNYSRNGVEITYIPVGEDKLKEILLRQFNLDVRIDLKAFVYFFIAFEEIESFDAMPWAERANALNNTYGISVSDRTLRSWCSKLMETLTINKTQQIRTYWRTTLLLNGTKSRELVDGNEEAEEEMKQYNSCKRKLLKEFSWEEANKILWNTFGCCYYSVPMLSIGATFELREDLQEIFELIEDSRGAAAAAAAAQP